METKIEIEAPKSEAQVSWIFFNEDDFINFVVMIISISTMTYPLFIKGEHPAIIANVICMIITSIAMISMLYMVYKDKNPAYVGYLVSSIFAVVLLVMFGLVFYFTYIDHSIVDYYCYYLLFLPLYVNLAMSIYLYFVPKLKLN